VGPDVAVRPFEARDVAAVAALEAASFSQPWSAETFARMVGQGSTVVRVVEREGEIIGYGILLLAIDEAEVANIAIRRDLRGCGFGACLLDAMLEHARSCGVTRVVLEVRESNEAALSLYASRGFETIGRRAGYYDAPREDARVLALQWNRTGGEAT
jgi:ribosomal-protein-alanine acetyltransferase